jgi:hypothetical protein
MSDLWAEDRIRFLELCEKSSFPHQKEVLEVVSAGSVPSKATGDVAAIDIGRVYEGRARGLEERGVRTDHSRTLLEDTLYFVDELKLHETDRIAFWSVPIDLSSEFIAFEATNAQRLIGCMQTVDKRKVTESEWNRLWGKEAIG